MVQAKADAAMKQQDAMVRRAVALGVKIALGTDAAVFPHGENALEFAFMAADGMTNAQALAKIGGGGTNCSAPLALLNKERASVDLVILVSDNGASGEGGPNGSVNEMKFANGIPDTMEANLPLIDELGGTKTYNHYPNGWAMAFNTPFKMWKRYEFNGGTSDPCIVSWPAGSKARGQIRDQYHHAIDIVPTILDVLGVDPPAAIGPGCDGLG